MGMPTVMAMTTSHHGGRSHATPMSNMSAINATQVKTMCLRVTVMTPRRPGRPRPPCVAALVGSTALVVADATPLRVLRLMGAVGVMDEPREGADPLRGGASGLISLPLKPGVPGWDALSACDAESEPAIEMLPPRLSLFLSDLKDFPTKPIAGVLVYAGLRLRVDACRHGSTLNKGERWSICHRHRSMTLVGERWAGGHRWGKCTTARHVYKLRLFFAMDGCILDMIWRRRRVTTLWSKAADPRGHRDVVDGILQNAVQVVTVQSIRVYTCEHRPSDTYLWSSQLLFRSVAASFGRSCIKISPSLILTQHHMHHHDHIPARTTCQHTSASTSRAVAAAAPGPGR